MNSVEAQLGGGKACLDASSMGFKKKKERRGGGGVEKEREEESLEVVPRLHKYAYTTLTEPYALVIREQAQLISRDSRSVQPIQIVQHAISTRPPSGPPFTI